MLQNKSKRKPIGERNGLKIYKKLKTNKQLKANKNIKPKTARQIKVDKEWSKVTNQKIKDLNYICQWCGQHGNRTGWNFLSGHHIKKRRFNDHSYSNCFIAHYVSCHSFIEQKGIDVRIYPTLKDWENRVEESH